jgi:hypothetical protein
MTEEPLRIDTDAVRQGGNEMFTGVTGLEMPPAFTPPTGSDPLSTRITIEVPSAEGPIVVDLPVLKEDAKKTAEDIVSAANRYEQTDQTLGQGIEQAQMPDANGVPASGGAGGVGGAQGAGAGQAGQLGQMGQLMGMPMQMAQQAAQLPMQALGMAASLPQAVMQGVQSAMQQVSQLGGSGEDTSKGETGVDEAQRAENANEKPQPEPEKEQGAAPGQSGVERAPESGVTGESPSQTAPPAPSRTPAPTRPAEANEGIDL